MGEKFLLKKLTVLAARSNPSGLEKSRRKSTTRVERSKAPSFPTPLSLTLTQSKNEGKRKVKKIKIKIKRKRQRNQESAPMSPPTIHNVLFHHHYHLPPTLYIKP